MSIADAFTIQGRGVVLTGRIDSGQVNVGDRVCLTAAKIGTRTLTVEAIEKARKSIESAKQGDLAGILVTGIEAKDVTRGGSDRLDTTCDAGAVQRKGVRTVTRFDIGDGKLPDWIPRFAGTTPQPKPAFYNHPVERIGSFTYDTGAPPREIYEFYRRALAKAGFVFSTEDETPISEALGNVVGSIFATAGNREVEIGVVREATRTTTNVVISYKEQLPAGTD